MAAPANRLLLHPWGEMRCTSSAVHSSHSSHVTCSHAHTHRQAFNMHPAHAILSKFGQYDMIVHNSLSDSSMTDCETDDKWAHVQPEFRACPHLQGITVIIFVCQHFAHKSRQMVQSRDWLRLGLTTGTATADRLCPFLQLCQLLPMICTAGRIHISVYGIYIYM
jgi:hypothetical protein